MQASCQSGHSEDSPKRHPPTTPSPPGPDSSGKQILWKGPPSCTPKTCFLPRASPCNNHTLLLKELPPAPECSPSSLVFPSSWKQVSAERGEVETARAGERNHWNEAPVPDESPRPRRWGCASFPAGPIPSQAPGVLGAVSTASTPAASRRTVLPLTSTHQEQRPPMPSTLVRRTAQPLDGQVSEATCTHRTASPPRQAQVLNSAKAPGRRCSLNTLTELNFQ